MRKGLAMYLAAEADLCVVGEAADGPTALDLATRFCPDIVLVDVEMPSMDGIAMTSTLHIDCPQVSVIILSIHDDVFALKRAAQAGAAAFVDKSMPADTLLTTIRQVVNQKSSL